MQTVCASPGVCRRHRGHRVAKISLASYDGRRVVRRVDAQRYRLTVPGAVASSHSRYRKAPPLRSCVSSMGSMSAMPLHGSCVPRALVDASKRRATALTTMESGWRNE
jgi:hypothetical protein